jgi:acetyl esterase/lipase
LSNGLRHINMTTRMRFLSKAAALAVAMAVPMARGAAPPSPAAALDTAALIATSHRVEPGLIYLSVGGWNGKLDLYLPRRPNGVLPTAILFHGGGWVTGTKDEIALDVLPYLAMGFAVANVDYRVARVATAPAAVEDSRCALRWVIRHAAQYGLDPARLVLVGSSAGAHLALMAALAPATAGFDGLCPGNEPLAVAAVVNFFGIADVGELLGPPNPRDFAVGWIGPGPDAPARAARVSPLTYVSKGAPAVLTLHGDADPVVPFTQATRLHAALDRVGAPNRLVPIRGGRHGDFGGNEVLQATHVVHDFLLKRGIVPPPKRQQAPARER